MTVQNQNDGKNGRRHSGADGGHRVRGPRSAAQQREAEARARGAEAAGDNRRGQSAAGETEPRRKTAGADRTYTHAEDGAARRNTRRPEISEDRTAKPVRTQGSAGRSGAERREAERSAADKNRSAAAYKENGRSLSGRGNAGGGVQHGGRNSGIALVLGGIVLAAAISIVLVLLFRGQTGGSEEMSSTAAETEETGPTFAENAIHQPAKLDVSVLLGGAALPESSAAESTEADGSAVSDNAGNEAAPEGTDTGAQAGILNVQGLTPEEIKSKVAELYSWNMKIYHEGADVGSVVKPTVDANETTEAATIGDAENPDSSPQEGLADDAAQQEITVTGEIAVPDLVMQKLDSLLSEIVSDDAAYDAALSNSEAADAAQAEGSEDAASSENGEAGAEDSEAAEPSGSNDAADQGADGADAELLSGKTYVLKLDGLEEAANKTASEAATMWYQMPQGGSIGSYDKANDKFIMEGAKAGFEVDQAALASAILSNVANGAFDARIDAPGRELSAEEATAAAEYRIIGSYTTKTTSNSVRNKNIALAAEAINGTILKPGEEFSFNNVVGQRTEAKGYGAAAAYNEGEVVQEVGGGICQVSTTLYNAVLRAGLKTTKRQSHTFEPSYVTPGRDATVSWGGPDYRFANVPSKAEFSNSNSYSIGIKAHYANREITISIYGRPVLKDGYSFDLKSSKVKDIDVVRKLIEPGSDKKPSHGTKGSQWVTNLVVTKDGAVVSDKLDHNTYYSGHIEYYTDAAQTTAAPAETTPQASVEETTPAPTDATLPTEIMPAETTTAAPQYETGVNGGPGVIISGGGQTAAPGPGEIGPGITEPQTTAAPPTETAAPAPQPQTTAAPAPQPVPQETAAPAGPSGNTGPAISDGPISDAPPAP